MYRIVCKFIPNQKTPTKGKFGGWKVVACMKATTASMAISKPVLVVHVVNKTADYFRATEPGDTKLLVLSSPVPQQRNSWCNPRKILDDWLRTERFRRALRTFGISQEHLAWVSVPFARVPFKVSLAPLHDVGGT